MCTIDGWIGTNYGVSARMRDEKFGFGFEDSFRLVQLLCGFLEQNILDETFTELGFVPSSSMHRTV